jgi:large subunit ribosomal protein L5
MHKPPGTVTVPKAERLRTWDDSSPYHKGRPKRGPRGPGEVLRLIERDITFRNIPKVEEITVHTMVKGALADSAHLHVAGILLQAITGVRPTAHAAKHNVATWGVRKGSYVSLTATMRNNDALEFLDKCIHLVFPRIKDWKGVKGRSSHPTNYNSAANCNKVRRGTAVETSRLVLTVKEQSYSLKFRSTTM